MIVFSGKTYKIKAIWFFKNNLISLPFLIIGFALYFTGRASVDVLIGVFVLVAVFAGGQLITDSLKASHFSFVDKGDGISFQEGVYAKLDQNIPYNSIQDVSIYRDHFDKIFGLASLTLTTSINLMEKIPGMITVIRPDGKSIPSGKLRVHNQIIGVMDKRIFIPGLPKNQAEELKALLLGKATSQTTNRIA